MAVYARYKSDSGEYLGGVPAKNLDEDEFKSLTDEQQEAVKASSIYSIAGMEKSAPKPTPAVTITPKDDGK